MSTRDRKISRVIGAVMILVLWAWIWAFSQISGGFPGTIISLFLMVLILLGLIIFGVHKASSRKTQGIEPMVDPTTSPVYYEETTPKDVESKTPEFSCPYCGYMNPGDADFCIKCGRDLEGSL